MKFLETFHVANGENERREIRYVRYSDSVILILYDTLPCFSSLERPFYMIVDVLTYSTGPKRSPSSQVVPAMC